MPFLSYGKTGMIVFVVIAAMLVRLAESGAARETTQELMELRKGALGGLAATVAVLAGAVGVAIWQGVVIADQTTTRGVVTLLAREPGETTDRVGHLHDPRLQAIADRIRRGDIVDRNGRDDRGHDPRRAPRVPVEGRAGQRPRHPARHRPAAGVDDRAAARGHAARASASCRTGRPCGWPRTRTAASACCSSSPPTSRTPRIAARRSRCARPGETIRLLALAAPDFRPLLPLLRMGAARREVEIKKVSADVKSRTAQITLDARLQVADGRTSSRKR